MLVTNRESFDRALADLHNISGPLVIDTETSGLQPFARENPARLTGIAIGDGERPGRDYYFAFRHGEGENLPLELLGTLREFVRFATWRGHNLSFDAKILACDGFDLPTHIEDTIIAAHLVNENEPSFALKELGTKYIAADAAGEEEALKAELKARKLKSKGDMHLLPASLVAPYALKDIELTRQLYALYSKELQRWGLRQLFAEVNEFSLALVRMETRGLLLDAEEVHNQIARIGPRIDETRARIRELAGYDINVNSPAQLKEWLKLPKTNKDTLVEAVQRDQREDCRLLLEYRELFKAESTYFRPFLERRDAGGRLHTSFKVHGTVTGRLSSSEPNLQNASRDQIGRAYSIRKCFVASPGHFLLEADYSAIEPRIAAHYSGDAVMKQAFFEGKDFHSAVARSVYKKAEISKAERTNAKTIGLMTLYGGGSHKAARKLGLRHERLADGSFAPCHHEVWAFQNDQLVQIPCSVADPEFCTNAGRAFRLKFFDGVPELQPFLKAVIAKAQQHGYVRNPVSGRVRRFTGPRAKPYSAPNSLIQSTAADILRRALVALDRLFTEPEHPRMVLSVHDSIVFEIPFGPSAIEHVHDIKRVMETTTKLEVPVVVDLKVGLSLGNMGDLHLAS